MTKSTSKKANPEPSFIAPDLTEETAIPDQHEYFSLPVRFGSVPVDEAPLGWEIETRTADKKVTRFQHAFPTIRLPFQEVQRNEYGHNDTFLAENETNQTLHHLFPTGANRLFFGDNLHIMRQLPSNSIDLIYIDPPFFSGRNYNVIFGDRNEVRSFSDIWEGGLPGYLVWLNARLYEMKRLLTPTGSIFVHLDWHASHYVKVEMDKIFGSGGVGGKDAGFKNEIIWCYSIGGRSKKFFGRKHDVILWYTKSNHWKFNPDEPSVRIPRKPGSHMKVVVDEDGVIWQQKTDKKSGKVYRYPLDKVAEDYWTDIEQLNREDAERVGYPTQKPEALLARIISAATNEGDVVADFFCGGGTTPVVAQRFNRRWIAADQSRIAVSITSDRISTVIEQEVGELFSSIPDFTIEHWGIYEAPMLETFGQEKFREFVVKAFGGKSIDLSNYIHGLRHGIPLFVGEPSRNSRITKEDVARFAKAVYEEHRGNFGVMLAWNFDRTARKAAELLAARENRRIDFVRLDLIRIESKNFREHVTKKHRDYGPLLRFIQPPEIKVNIKRIQPRKYLFDVSESVSLNSDGMIANVQWDFDYIDGKFTSTQGYSFMRDKSTNRPVLVVDYEFPVDGKYNIACSIQDDQGGERTLPIELEVK